MHSSHDLCQGVGATDTSTTKGPRGTGGVGGVGVGGCGGVGVGGCGGLGGAAPLPAETHSPHAVTMAPVSLCRVSCCVGA